MVLCLLAMALLSAVMLATNFYLSEKDVPFAFILFIKIAIWLFWGGWLPIIFYLSKTFPIRKGNAYLGFFQHLPLSILIIVLHIFFYAALVKFTPFSPFQGQDYFPLFRGFLLSQFEWYFMTYWALVIASYAVNYYQKFREGDLRTAQLEMRLTKAQLMALKMQLQPHFLFNTLNTIASLVRQDEKKKAISMLSEMGDLLRTVLKQNDDQFIPLKTELDFINKYIALEAKRFKNKMQVNIEVPTQLLDAIVPNFLLQPLIENSIYHGLSKKMDARELSISINKEKGNLNFRIYNDGPLLPPHFNLLSVEGIGLANTIERLSQLYPNQYVLHFTNKEQGVLVVLTIPYQPNKSDDFV